MIDFIKQLPAKDKKRICLFSDYELLDQNINGIEVIKQTDIKRSTLVTSHYADNEIRKQAIETHVKVLPKELAFAVNIKVDIVWVDDDKMSLDWLVKNTYKYLTVDAYYEPLSFLEDVAQYPLDTKIVLDNYYYDYDIECNLTGLIIAQDLHKRGYTNLILLSGEEPSNIPSYLTVVLKTDLTRLYSLDKL